ncbi:MAG: hypothetical protein QF464_05285 [Myxococcota bacterium]|nr:hypothetical protein [Myxococcota bacterium]
MTLVLGPMFAGKTSELRRRIEAHARCGLRAVLVRPARDDRGSADAPLFTHRGDVLDESLAANVTVQRVETLADVALSETDGLVAVDEGQFFGDLAGTIRRWADGGRTVVVAALNGKSDRSDWRAVGEALAEADAIEHLTAVCMRCRRPDRPAIFSALKGGGAAGVLIGGKELYEATCRSCAGGSPAVAKNDPG